MDRHSTLQVALLLVLPVAFAACDVYTPELLRGSGQTLADSGGTGDRTEADGGTSGRGPSGGLGGFGIGGSRDGSGGGVPSGGDSSAGGASGTGSASTGGLAAAGTSGSQGSTGGAAGERSMGGTGGTGDGSGSGGLATGGDDSGGLATGGASSGGAEASGGTAGIAAVAAGAAPLAGAPNGGAAAGGPPDGGAAGSATPTGGEGTGGAPSGGQQTGGVSTGGEATGGAPTGGQASGGAPSGGAETGGLPAGITVIDLLDDANNTIELSNGEGLWYVFHDGSADGVITPDTPRDTTARVVPVSLPAARDGSLLGVHVVADDGFAAWGAGVGFNLNSPDSSTRLPYDVSPYAGIVLWARSGTGTVTLRLKLVTADIAPDTEPGGECAENCSDAFGTALDLTEAWREYSVPFSALTQQGWGNVPPAGFDPTSVLAVQLHADAGVAFDLWLDDVRFYE